MIDGVKVSLGGVDYIVPPLSFKQIKNLKGSLNLTVDSSQEDQLEAAVDIIHAALTRNYPSLSRDRVEEDIDLGNVSILLDAVRGINGFKQSTGEGQSLGE